MQQIWQARLGWIELYEFVVFCHNRGMSRAIKTSRRRSSRVFTISFPDPLAKQVIAVAKDENRNISELFREAFRTYRMERMRSRLAEIRAEAAKRVTHRYAEEDVEALVDEIRGENFNKRRKTA
jgi:hypothetical protein